MQLGYVMSRDKGAVDRTLSALATRLAAQGLRLGGVVQYNVNCQPDGRCDMDAQVLPDGPVIRISQSLGAGARGCKLDPGALEDAAGLVSGRLNADTDLLIVNKFGKHEADGRGFRPVIADALALDIPVLCGVGSLNLPAFQSFAGDLAKQIEMTDPALDDWLARSLSERA